MLSFRWRNRPSSLICCLVLSFVFASLLSLLIGSAGAAVPGGRLPTRWDVDVSSTLPLPEYPRPQMTRAKWLSLNGPWDYELTDSTVEVPPASYTKGHILVPFCYEAALSGCGELGSIPNQRLWYRRSFTVPASWNHMHVLLHFGAVNWDSSVYVNGHEVGTHRGGYDRFTFDITPYVTTGPNRLEVSAWNPVSSDNPNAQVVGKQRVHPVSVLYTAATGIWQSVWIEPTPAISIDGLKLTPDIDAGVLHVSVLSSSDADVRVSALDGRQVVGQSVGKTNDDVAVNIPHAHLWSANDPHLYTLNVETVGPDGSKDAVGSYFAMRKISLGKDAKGRTCIFLNNKYLLEIGLLDQGYWPDGIYTAPTESAMVNDISQAKQLGFNLLRKHAKVEPDRWYYDCDRLGMLVWQDMPQMFGDNFTDSAKLQWLTEWKSILSSLYNHPCIVVWTLFNEGWGQHDTESITDLTRGLDPTRLIDSGSGGYNQIVNGKMSEWRLPTPLGVGDINDTHVYPEPDSEKAEARAIVTGEFGGIGMRVPGHDWNDSNFAYGAAMSGSAQLTRRYQSLLKDVFALAQNQGTCAFVYTQLTDVEDETNGMMTYDRDVLKPNATYVADANRGDFPTLPSDPTVTVIMPTSEDVPQNWNYVTSSPGDGWQAPAFNDSTWKIGKAPFGQGYGGVNTPWTDTPGDIWMRRTIDVTGAIPQKLIAVTQHDEDVQVYINGMLAVTASGYTGGYVDVPISTEARAALLPGKNVIAVHCHQTVGGQFVDVGIQSAPKSN